MSAESDRESRAQLPMDELISAHLQNELTEPQREQLNQRLQQEATAREQFLAALRQDILLGEVLREQVEHAEQNKPAASAIGTQANVWRTSPTQRAWRVALVVAALVMLTVAIFMMLRSHETPLEVAKEALSLNAVVLRDGVSSPLSDGVVLTTQTDTLAIQYDDHTKVVLKENSSATFKLSPSGGKSIALDHGVVSAEVTKQPANQPMILSTNQVEATVLGTRFTLSTESGKSTLSVEEGRVRLMSRSNQKSLEVNAGFVAVANTPSTEIDLHSIVQNTVLLVTAERIPAFAHDVALKSILEEMGYMVIEKTFNEVTLNDATDKVLIIVPSHLCSGTRVFADAPVPVICWHPVWFEDLGMTDPNLPKSDILKRTSLQFTPHSKLTGITPPVNSTATLTTYAFAKPAGPAQVIAHVLDQPVQGVLFGYEKNHFMHHSSAPARRMAFSIDVRNSAGSPADLSKNLFKAAVKWATSVKTGE